jgi:hypothetical protein
MIHVGLGVVLAALQKKILKKTIDKLEDKHKDALEDKHEIDDPDNKQEKDNR